MQHQFDVRLISNFGQVNMCVSPMSVRCQSDVKPFMHQFDI